MPKYYYPDATGKCYAEKIAQAIQRNKYTIIELMKRTGVSRYRIKKVLSGKISPKDLYPLDFVLQTGIF